MPVIELSCSETAGSADVPLRGGLEASQALLGRLGLLPKVHVQTPGLRVDPDVVSTNLDTKTGGPLRCAAADWSWRRKHPELTITELFPPGFVHSKSDGRCVYPETKTSMIVGSMDAFIGGRASPSGSPVPHPVKPRRERSVAHFHQDLRLDRPLVTGQVVKVRLELFRKLEAVAPGTPADVGVGYRGD